MQTTVDHNQSSNEKMSQVSLRKGYWFYFDHEGNDISMYGSAWSGKEKVYFNNKEVSSFRNISSRTSEHCFEQKGHQYKLSTNLTSFLKGSLEVTLYCDDKLIKTEAVSAIGDKKYSWWIGGLFVLGAFAGGYGSYYLLTALFG
jgi:hypothetical protein